MSHPHNPKGLELQQLDPVRRQYQEPRHKRGDSDRKEVSLVATKDKLGKRKMEVIHHCHANIVELCHEYCIVQCSKVQGKKTKAK